MTGPAVQSVVMSNDSTQPQPPLLILCRDLLFSSKITGAAQAVGVPFKVVRDPAKLASEPGRRLIVDLNQDGAIDAAIAWRHDTSNEVVGFVAHVDTETIRRAREGGVDHVLARSQFVAQLAQLISLSP
ncbi:MAG: hypothetical protein WBD40_13380 [Tepidisphaeraceae bacterium]